MKRRSFITKSCTVCLGAMAGLSLVAMAESCAAGKILKKDIVNELITVSNTEFVQGQSFVIVRTPTLAFDILLNHNQDDTYTALYMQCTHYDNPVYANKTEIFCPSHGSKFDFTGKVTKEPATRNLKQYNTEKKGTDIIIHLT